MSYQTKTLREPFCESYYKTRNYRDYLTRKFSMLASDISYAVPLTYKTRLLDFGCGYGGLVAAFHINGYHNMVGTDISQWAIEEGHRRYPFLKSRLQFYNRDLLRRPHDVLLMLDVLEHMPEYEIVNVLKLAREGCKGVVVVRIPVSAEDGEPFVLPVSNNDPTHISCHTKQWWNTRFYDAHFSLSGFVESNAIYDSPGVLAATYQPK